MPTRITRLCALMGVIALLLMSVPVGAVDRAGICPMDDNNGANESGCACLEETNANDRPVEGDCCPSECQDCFLQCCNGFLALKALSVVLGVDPLLHHARSTDNDQISPAHPRAIYHPPRS